MKKFLSLVMACALTASLLAGCGTKNNAPMDDVNTPASDSNGATGDTVTGDDNIMTDGDTNTATPSVPNDDVVGSDVPGVPDATTDNDAVTTPPVTSVPNAKP